MIPIVRSVIAVSNQLFQSIPDLFLFSSVSHLLMYIYYHMVYHMSSVFLENMQKSAFYRALFAFLNGRNYLIIHSSGNIYCRSEHLGSNQSLQPVKLYVFPLNYIPSAATKRIGGFFRTSGDMRLSVLAFYL